MTEAEAQAWLAARAVPRGTMAALHRFVSFLHDENARQNLVSAASLSAVWARHIVDSAQLIDHAPPGTWLDLGSGAGFPGLIVAALSARPVTLVESRAKRIAFLGEAIARLGIGDHVTLFGGRLETLAAARFAVISARAFAPLPRLLAVASRFADGATTWLLPKGQSATRELAEIAPVWQGEFRIVPSITDPDAAIIVARNVCPRKRR